MRKMGWHWWDIILGSLRLVTLLFGALGVFLVVLAILYGVGACT